MQTDPHNLSRFLEAQNGTYENALSQIRNSKKTGHWMWFIFPQLAGLGYSEMAKFYAIHDITEAEEYLNHPILGQRLINISNELLKLKVSNAISIFGEIDSIKLKSSITLFSHAKNANSVFNKVLVKFFEGHKDEKTTLLLSNQR